MKKLMMLLMVSVMGIGYAQVENNKASTKRAVATYTGSSTQGYYFTNDLDESSMLFNKVRPDVLKKYDLSDRSYIRETFRVYYNVETIKNKKIMTIIDMELLDYDEDEEDIEGS